MFFHLLHIILIIYILFSSFLFSSFFKTITHYIVALRAWSVNVQLQVTLFIVKHIKLTKSYLCSCGCLSDKRVGSMFTKQDKCVEKLSFPGGEGCCFCLLVVFLLLLFCCCCFGGGSCCFFIHVLDRIIHTSLLVHKPDSFCINISQDSCIL